MHMRQYLFILLFLSALNAQNSSFNSFDVVIYPEYYFEGIMAEVDAEVEENKFPLTLRMNIPSSSDSVFFVGGTPSNDSNVKTLSILKEGKASSIEVDVLESKFRLFIFYDLVKNKDERSGSFELRLNHSIDDAHIMVQEPLVAESFTFSENDAESFQDQHGLNFKRIHLNNYKANTSKTVTFDYRNPSGDISINVLQNRLSNDESISSPPEVNSSITPPIRHKLPLWQPLLVLGLVAIVVAWMFSVQLKKEKAGVEKVSTTVNKKGGFCTHCGKSVQSKNKFCANCGGKL
ncbi:MAG: hypothetical protein CMG22_04765 [Candidatus Marinimicrobia bacterium]|nr:hypothetical protein [Candidatus Neomarinimicrobiota bacterium]